MRRLLALAAGLLLFSIVMCSIADAATLYISEFKSYPGLYQAAFTPELTHQTVSIGGTSTQSAAFNVSTSLIRVEVDAIACVQIGTTTPTAVAQASMRMAAGQTEYFIVTAGDKLAVISCT